MPSECNVNELRLQSVRLMNYDNLLKIHRLIELPITDHDLMLLQQLSQHNGVFYNIQILLNNNR